MSRLRTPFVILSLLPLMAAASGGALAAEFGTRDQLSACLATEAGLTRQREGLEASAKSREQLLAQVTSERKVLAKMRQDLNRDSKASVDAFNDAARKHNMHVHDLNKSSADAKPANDSYKAAMASYNQQCAAKSYRPEDMEAVKAERAKAASAP